MVTVHFGTDIDRSWDANEQGDFKIVSDLDNAKQAIYNRLMTSHDELKIFGYTDYGNQSFEVLGETDLEVAKEKLILYTKQCLLKEPRVQEVININADFNGNSASIMGDIQIIGEDTNANFVINIGSDV